MTSRRDVLRTLGVGAGAVAFGARVHAGGTSDTPARTIRIEAREVTWELAPGRTVKAMAYNGRIPGPEIRVREGERVRVELTNALAEPTTIHWHGVDVPNAMDGVPGLTQEPVAPGATFVYEFEARPAGTRWYHTHFAEHRQLDLGLAAAFIVEPRAAEPITYDREVTLVLDDWATGHGKPLPTAGGMGGGGMMGGMMRGRGGMMGGRRSGRHAEYDTMTINGKAYPATEPLRLKKGERVRLRVISVSAEHTHLLRLTGHRLHVTHTDGNPLVTPVEVDALPIAPGERYDALLVAERPGAWFLQCLAAGHADAGEKMAVLYDGHERQPPAASQERLAGLDVWDHGFGRGRPVLVAPTGATRRFDLMLSGGMMGSDVWTINGKRYPNTEPLSLQRGERAVVRFGNMSPEAHPMHLHGQSFRVLSVNGVRYAEPVVKDVIDVRAHMGSAVVEFTAHNPGDWFFHCHKPSHMDGGMIAVARIAGA